MKKTVCLLTNWYPTKENPYAGLFFKEQAFAVSDAFDFKVVKYREHMRKKPWKKPSVSIVNKEGNTIEYDIDVYVPLRIYLADIIHNFKVKRSGKTIEGVGKYVSEARKKFTKDAITKLFEEHVGDADVFYCIDAQKDAYYLQYLSEYFKKPYVAGEHAPVPWPGTVLRDIDKEAIEKADLFLAISYDKMRQLMLQNIRLPKSVYIGNLIDEDMFPIRTKSNDIKTFIIVAANSFYKNYDMFISVMNRLTEICDVPFRVRIVGYASNKGYSKNKEEFEEKIANSKFSKVAELVPAVEHSVLWKEYAKADAFVMTSIQEGQPVSAMEAACCGLPIFSTACGGVEDYVDESIGRIYAISDVDGMAQGLKNFLEGEVSFDKEHIREKVISLFGKKAFTDNFKDAFDSVINNAKS